MLEFFRRYQRGLFIVITVVIVISFSFFGTFQTFADKEQEDKVAFTALDGTKIRTSEVADMVAFLSSDSHDYLMYGSGNPLNDGALASDILESGLAQVVAAPYLTELGQELKSRHEREKRYKTYAHPKAPFLTSEQIWTYYAPDVKTNFDMLRSSDNAASKAAFNARVNLFVAERRFPAPYLRQFLRYQEASHKWLGQDPNLQYADLSLFGYHSAQDWFGRQFVELAAQFIINSAKLAEAKGYEVTKEEAVASLYRSAEEAFQEARAQGVANAQNAGDFFQEQLRRLGMDQSRAVKLWRDVLLFRTLFFENADSILVDTASYKDFYHHLNEYVDVDLYRLPSDLRFSSLKDLEQFAFYLNAVRLPDGSKDQNPIRLPVVLASPQAVKKSYPELVERTYTVKFAEVNKESLETKIGVRGTWEWQVKDANWQELKKKYPELANKDDSSVEARLKVLDGLDPAKRAQVDTHSRQKIVDEHPEWLTEALQQAPQQEKQVALRSSGIKSPFTGFKNTQELMELFNKAPLNEVAQELAKYSQDNVHYVQVVVLDKSSPERVLTFSEAKSDGTMDQLLNKALEASYPRLRSKESSLFLKDNGEWKPFKEVKSDLAKLYFADMFRLLDHQVEVYKKKLPDYTDWKNKEQAQIAVALLPYVQDEIQDLKQKMAASQEWPDEAKKKDQFALVKSRERLVRSGPDFVVNPELAFSMEREVLSPLTDYQKSGPCFFMVLAKGFLPSQELLRNKVLEERELLGKEAMMQLASDVLSNMQKKGAYSLSFLQADAPSESTK